MSTGSISGVSAASLATSSGAATPGTTAATIASSGTVSSGINLTA